MLSWRASAPAGAAAPARTSAPERLPRRASWRAATLVGAGAVLPVTVSIGPMAAQLGGALVLVWAVAALIGTVQCVLLADLARRYPDRAGGTAMYAEVTLRGRWRPLAAVSSWGYWLAWTPGIAVNLMLAAGYLQALTPLPFSRTEIAAALAAALYALSARGLRWSLRIAAALAPLATLPLLALLVGGLLAPGHLHLDNLTPLSLPHHRALTPGSWPLMVKWLFVAAWSAYGAELASTVVAELRDPGEAPRALAAAAGIGMLGFAVLPAVLVAVAGAPALAGDPATALLPAARSLYGNAGATALSLMLAAALIAGAQAYMVGSSRTIFQMARDGLLPRALATVNGRGAPVGGVLLDATLIAVMLAAFGTQVLAIVAAANVAYLAVMAIMPLGYLAAGAELATVAGGPLRARSKRVLALLLCAGNTGLLVVGTALWGTRVALVGAGLLAGAVPLKLLQRRRRREHGGRTLGTRDGGTQQGHPIRRDRGVPTPRRLHR